MNRERYAFKKMTLPVSSQCFLDELIISTSLSVEEDRD